MRVNWIGEYQEVMLFAHGNFLCRRWILVRWILRAQRFGSNVVWNGLSRAGGAHKKLRVVESEVGEDQKMFSDGSEEVCCNMGLRVKPHTAFKTTTRTGSQPAYDILELAWRGISGDQMKRRLQRYKGRRGVSRRTSMKSCRWRRELLIKETILSLCPCLCIR